MLRIHNSMTGEKQPFEPLVPGHVSIYVCGVTVYDLCHIGHARTFVNFDVIVRYLRYLGYAVTYVRNITDIDDKIIRRAAERGISTGELAAEFIGKMHEDFAALNIAPPDIEPRATGHIPDIISLVQKLLDSGHAYVTPGGDVLFDISTYPDYGQLSGQNLEDLQAGARVDVDPDKRSPLDFVLWKKSKPGEPVWDSPWGGGRPGWHIECSAMSSRYLGESFDIHGGGSDLLFPHHENERAQSCCCGQGSFARCWMHSGMVMINAEKMSKSLNNFFTIRDVLEIYDPETVRFFLMSGQYRSQLNYADEHLNRARAGLTRLYTALRDVTPQPEDSLPSEDEFTKRFCADMDDDFNTPGALSVLFDLAHEIHRDESRAAYLAARLRQLGGVLGILQQDSGTFLQGSGSDSDQEMIEKLVAERTAARAARNWKRADEIRDELRGLGVELEDGAGGTTWHRV